jgi:hypothetical protein
LSGRQARRLAYQGISGAGGGVVVSWAGEEVSKR